MDNTVTTLIITLLLFSVCQFLVVQLCAAFRRMGHQSIIHKTSPTWHLLCKPELSVEKQKFQILLMPYKYETETWIIFYIVYIVLLAC